RNRRSVQCGWLRRPSSWGMVTLCEQIRPGGSPMLRRSFVGLGAAACALAALPFAAPALAQDYPDRPITLIVPWGAGGGTDATARIIGAVLEGELGQPISVVNRTGGSGVVGHSGIAEA